MTNEAKFEVASTGAAFGADITGVRLHGGLEHAQFSQIEDACRRATSEITTPSTMLSATIVSFSCVDHVPSTLDARDDFDPPQRLDLLDLSVITMVKTKVAMIVRILVHGPTESPLMRSAARWGRGTAYITPRDGLHSKFSAAIDAKPGH